MQIIKPGRRLVIILGILLFCRFELVFCQESASSSANSDFKSTAASATAEIAKSIDLSSPRAAIKSFLDAMNDVKAGKPVQIVNAMKTMELAGFPEEERELRGLESAKKLADILNSLTFKIDAIPEKTSEKLYALPAAKERGFDISLKKAKDGTWRFSFQNTLQNVNVYYEKIQLEAEKASRDSTVDIDLRSPRDTMAIFSAGIMKIKGKTEEDAFHTLDLSQYDAAVRRDIARERAFMLKYVLDRHKNIDLVEIPNDPSGPPYIHLRHPAGSIILERIAPANSKIESWKFSAKTIDELPSLYDAFRDKPLAEGVTASTEVPISVKVRDYMLINFPGLMQRSIILENWQWLGLFCIVFIGIGLSKILTMLIRNSIRMLFRRESFQLDSYNEKRFVKPIGFTFTAWAWWLGISILGLPGDIRLLLLVTVKLVTAVTGIWAAYRLMDVVGAFLSSKAAQTENKFDDILAPLVTRTLKVVSIAFGLVFIADIFAWEIDKILAGLGLGGLAFALAAKDTVANIFGSLTVLIDRPFEIGDWVTIGNVDGTVETVGVRSTRIRTFYNSLITLPNSQLTNATIDNMGARKYRRIYCNISITYDTNPDKIEAFCEGIRQLIRIHPYTRKDFFLVHLNELADSALTIMLYCFVKTPDWGTELRERHRLLLDIIRLAGKLGVEFAFPTHTIYTRKEEKTPCNAISDKIVDSISLGRTEAANIVRETLGDPPSVPPAVVFE